MKRYIAHIPPVNTSVSMTHTIVPLYDYNSKI